MLRVTLGVMSMIAGLLLWVCLVSDVWNNTMSLRFLGFYVLFDSLFRNVRWQG